MCGRYVVKHSREEMQSAFEFSSSEIRLPPRFNIAPTTQVPVVCQNEASRRELLMARWGLIPSWAKPDAKLPLLINARAESIAIKPAFRSAFKGRRCLFPASGYFEWKLQDGAKQPYFISRIDGRPLAFAGLWERSKDADGREITSAAIVTTAAIAELATIHDRMPLFLPPSAWHRWLAPEALPAEEAASLMGAGLPDPMKTVAVRSLVNNIKNQGEELLQPARLEVMPQWQPDLFG